MSDLHGDVLIAGGGITALSAAWHLQRVGRRVVVVCDADHFGGVIRSRRKGEWLCEEGPNSYASFGAEEEELLGAIGLAERAIRRPLRDADRFIYHSGRLHRVPTGPLQFLASGILPLRERLRVVRGALRRYQAPAGDVTIGQFFRGLLGDAAVDTLLRPGLAGIYAADADRLSLDATLPRLAAGLRSSSRLVGALRALREPVVPGMPPLRPKALTSFPDGLAELPRSLESRLRDAGASFVPGVRVRLDRFGSNWRFAWESGSAEAPAVILTTPAPAAAQLLEPHAADAARILAGFEHTPLTVVHAGVRAADVSHPLHGFGFLTRRGESVRMLGSIWSSSVFPGRAPAGHHLLTCFFGGELDPEASEFSDDQLRAQTAADLASVIGWRGREFALFRIKRWTPALPVFRVGHMDAVNLLKEQVPPGIHLAAIWLGGVSIPDRIRNGRAAAEAIVSAGAVTA